MSGVVVLGGGVAGESFVAALRRENENVPITLVERELVGGECSYWACIPSKTLLRPYEVAHRARAAPGLGESVTAVDVKAVFGWRDEISGKDDTSQVEWIEGMGAKVVRGTGVVAEAGLVRVGDRELPYDDLMITTGSLPVEPPIEGLTELGAWSSREGTSVSEVPEALVIVGGGAVGCELAQLYARMGSRVSVVQSDDHLLPRVDREAGELLAEVLADDGVRVLTGTKPAAVEGGGGRFRLTCEGKRSVEVEGTHILIAIGRRPDVEGFGFEHLPVTVEKNGLKVDEGLSAAEGVWGAGDVTGVSLFTHVGKYQARVAAANVAGGNNRADYKAIPSAVFTDPQVAAVGDTSGDGAVTASYSIEKVSRASTFAKPKRRGFVKLYADADRGVLVGATAVGPEAGEWLGQLTLAVKAEVPVETLRDTIQPFPTFSEAIFFAARDLAL